MIKGGLRLLCRQPARSMHAQIQDASFKDYNIQHPCMSDKQFYCVHGWFHKTISHMNVLPCTMHSPYASRNSAFPWSLTREIRGGWDKVNDKIHQLLFTVSMHSFTIVMK